MKKNWKKGMLILLIAVSVMPMKYYYENRKLQKDIAEKILRFHVIANSDSSEDQALKLKVRDAVGIYMKDEMKDVKNLKEAEKTADANMAQIETIAQEVIKEEGKTYTVSAFRKQVDFPAKTYGNYSFPAGTYEAVEVVIGEGKGQNWWCVMYPNMCFQGSMYEVIDTKAQVSLQEVLTQEEYDSIIEDGSYQIKCKYLSFLNKYL
ncbi:MAG: stage II sporulation protein R [Lachnospiraceae bacterium]